MIKIQSGDYRFFTVSSSTGYNGSDAITIANIDVSYDFRQKWEQMSVMLQEWQEQKRLIESNQAVRNAWNNFQLLSELAKKETENV